MISDNKDIGLSVGKNELLMEACGVHFAYTPKKPVVRDLSISLSRGTLTAVIGANGSGKSTVIRLLLGLITPAQGEIRFEGRPLRLIPRRLLARRVAYVPQIQVTAFPFTVLEMVLTGRSPHAGRFCFESPLDCEKAIQALERVGALHLASRPVTELSGGERQLVAVARALAQEPNCLVLDEPAAALDLKHRAALIRTLQSLRHDMGLTALVVTHDLQLLSPGFDRVYAMRAGTLVASGTPSDVLCNAVLANVFDDSHVRIGHIEGRTFVWSET